MRLLWLVISGHGFPRVPREMPERSCRSRWVVTSACHPSVFAPRCSRLEHALPEHSLALLCMFLAETWRSLESGVSKKDA